MIEDQLIHVETTTARLSAEALAKLLSVSAHALAEHHYSTKTGAQSLSQLNRQGRPLNSIEVDSEALKDIKQQMKAYSVDFAVTKDKDTGNYSLWFKGQDIERIQMALEHCIIDRGKDSKVHSKLQAICDHAKELANQLNTKVRSRQPERGERL